MSEKKISIIASDRQYIIGTAGHIDHGKTALVKALTGINTDKLPEEKSRGITIDLGFAHLSENITIIDVPGHERLIKNMVAGVSTIDMVLFVIAADDGVMPQSREHFDILNLLQIQQGIFVITKCDLVDPDWLDLVEEDIQNLTADTPFASAPILRTSTIKNLGITELQEALQKKLVALPTRQDMEIYRQPVDRVFSAKGFGTVITGTVLSGKLQDGDEVEIQPIEKKVRVRGLQTHDEPAVEVSSGFRSAVNLAGIELKELQRGMVLTQPDIFEAVTMLNARLTLLKNAPDILKNNQRIRLHIHTAEAFARVIIPHAPQLNLGETAFVQLRLEQPIHVAFQDRFIIRQYSPQRTLGGGIVLQLNPIKYRKKNASIFLNSLNMLTADEPETQLLGAFDPLRANPLSLWNLKTATNFPVIQIQQILKKLQSSNQVFVEKISAKAHYLSVAQLETISAQVKKKLAQYHQEYPGRAGIGKDEILGKLEKFYRPEAIRKALQFGITEKKWISENQKYRLQSFIPQLTAKDSDAYLALGTLYKNSGFTPPTAKEAATQLAIDQKIFKELTRLHVEEKNLLYVDAGLFYTVPILEKLVDLITDFFKQKDELSVAEFKELTQTTRKHAIPLLTYLDNQHFTERDGDVRKPNDKLNK